MKFKEGVIQFQLKKVKGIRPSHPEYFSSKLSKWICLSNVVPCSGFTWPRELANCVNKLVFFSSQTDVAKQNMNNHITVF